MAQQGQAEHTHTYKNSNNCTLAQLHMQTLTQVKEKKKKQASESYVLLACLTVSCRKQQRSEICSLGSRPLENCN